MPVLNIDPTAYDDTELGALVRDAYANGNYVVVLMLRFAYCERCDTHRPEHDTCAGCGDED